jgi:hypothetical protein
MCNFVRVASMRRHYASMIPLESLQYMCNVQRLQYTLIYLVILYLARLARSCLWAACC